MRLSFVILSSALTLLLGFSRSADGAEPGFWRVARLTGEDLGCLLAAPIGEVTLLACGRQCGPIPWQLDERDAHGRLALEQGPQPNTDDPPGVIDANDELLWMVEDAGRRMRPRERPTTGCALEIHVHAPRGARGGWIYALASESEAHRSTRRYVSYDPQRDQLTGARVTLGFDAPTPQHLSVRRLDGAAGPNLLDRLKVRVSARFLGIIPVGRDEGDLTSELVAWHAGPIRVVRRQHLWAYVGFGLRSPTFASDTYFYRDYAEMPVSLRLNFPPTYFFRGVEVRALLDFRDLRGWRMLADGLEAPVTVGGMRAEAARRLEQLPGDWFGLLGPDITLVQMLGTSPSLTSVERHLLYRDTRSPQAPEAVPGEMPGIGYRLTEWNDVGAGTHWFSSTSFALPVGYDLRQFLREQAEGIRVEVRPLRSTGRPPD